MASLSDCREFCDRVLGPIEKCPNLAERERIEGELETWTEELAEEAEKESASWEKRCDLLKEDVDRLERENSDLASERDAALLDVTKLENEVEELESKLQALRESHIEDDFGERP